MSNAANRAGLQELTDRLARQIGRSVAVDDETLTLLCASAQGGVIDERRIDAIIKRSPPPEPIPWMLSCGIADAVDPVRLPRNPEFDMLPRVCFPIRSGGQLLGYLWLFDEPQVTDEDIRVTSDSLGGFARLLTDDGTAAGWRRAASQALGERLVRGDVTAADEAEHHGLLRRDGDLVVHDVALVGRDAVQAEAKQHVMIELANATIPHPCLALEHESRLVVVERRRQAQGSRETIEQVRRAAHRGHERVAFVGSATVGRGSPVATALRHARFCTDLAAVLAEESGTMAWEAAGAWRLLLGWPLEEHTVAGVSPAAAVVLEDGNPSHAETLLSYFDNARDTTATSQALFIHRATLHYRLARIRELVGAAALDDGWEATAMHVALRLAAALHSPRHES